MDLRKVTWVLSGDEHVAEYRPPANVVPIEAGKKMADMLAAASQPRPRPRSSGPSATGQIRLPK